MSDQYTTGVTEQRERASEFPTAREELESLRQQLASRDAEIATLREQVTLLRDALQYERSLYLEDGTDIREETVELLIATEPKS